MTKGVLMLAHRDWMSFHQRNSVGGFAIFSASNNKKTRRGYLEPLFCVRPGSPPRNIVAVGFIQSQREVYQETAWAKYGPALGAASETEWRAQAAKVLENSRMNYAGRMLAIELIDFQPFPSPVSPSDVGLTDTGWQNLKIIDEEPTRRLLDLLAANPTSSRPPERLVLDLKQRFDRALAGYSPAAPEALRRVQRFVKLYERPQAITRYVKQTRGTDCQLCGEPGFLKRDGSRYCEVHHLFHLSTLSTRRLPQTRVSRCPLCNLPSANASLQRKHTRVAQRRVDGHRGRS